MEQPFIHIAKAGKVPTDPENVFTSILLAPDPMENGQDEGSCAKYLENI